MNLKELADTKLFNDVIVKEYQNGNLYRTYGSKRINFGGLGSMMWYFAFIIIAITLGIVTTLLAPGYVYMIYLTISDGNKNKSIIDLSNFAGLFKLRLVPKIKRQTNGWLYSFLFLGLGLMYLMISISVIGVLAGIYNDKLVFSDLSLVAPAVLAMIVTSAIIAYYTIPIMKKESAFEFMMFNFENNFQGMLVQISEQAKDIISKNGKKSDEYKSFVENTIEEFSKLANQKFSNENITKQFTVFLYTFLMSIKGNIHGIKAKISPIILLIISIIIIGVIGSQLNDSYKNLEPKSVKSIEKNHINNLSNKDLETAIFNKPELLSEMKNIDEEVLINVVHKKPELIEYIDNPSNKVIDAVRNSPNKKYNF